MKTLEGKINDLIRRFPLLRKIVKRLYQLIMYTFSKKVKFEGDIKRISPDDGFEYFFGYYDKSPWDVTDRYMLCMRAQNTYSSVAPNATAEIILFDTHNNNSIEVIGKTNSWNVQQGCMLQWLGPDYSEKVIFNDFRDGEYCAIILNIKTREEVIINRPVYSVSEDGAFALSLDFSRLHRLRKGYGYSNKEEKNRNEKCPDDTCIWNINLKSGEVRPILKYVDFYNFNTRVEMENSEHKVNHLMISPSGNRFMVLHRWFNGSRKYTRLITANCDGTELFLLNDDNMTSHCFWKNDDEIVAYAHKFNIGNGYYLFKDRTQNFQKLWDSLTTDGHPSYSKKTKRYVTDTYPNKSRIATIYCIKNDDIQRIARVFAPFRYDNDVRCDLHPRWSREGDKICFDSVFEGKRGLYIIENV